MMCYRDMTFCTEETCKKFGDGENDCGRSLTKKVKKAAAGWWGQGDAPIAMFIDKPDCYQEKDATS